MANFKLREGERILESVGATALDRKRREVPARLVLTTDRVALCFDPERGAFIGLFGAVGGILGGLFAGAVAGALDVDHGHVEQQIAREDFADVEVDDKWLVVRTGGEGYERTTLAVRVKDLDGWQQRIHRWASGTESAAALPVARVIRDE